MQSIKWTDVVRNESAGKDLEKNKMFKYITERKTAWLGNIWRPIGNVIQVEATGRYKIVDPGNGGSSERVTSAVWKTFCTMFCRYPNTFYRLMRWDVVDRYPNMKK